MGKLKVDIPHSLPVDDARKRLDALLGYWSRKYGVKGSWNGDNATFNGKAMGVTFEGTMQLLANKCAIESVDPGFLLRGQAEKYLRRKFGDYLDPKKSLADLAKDD
jgi:hypothetical protein